MTPIALNMLIVRSNSIISVFNITGLKILGKGDAHFVFVLFFLEKI